MSDILLLQPKCPVIAHDAGLPVGSIVLKRGRGTGRAIARMVGKMDAIGVENQRILRLCILDADSTNVGLAQAL